MSKLISMDNQIIARAFTSLELSSRPDIVNNEYVTDQAPRDFKKFSAEDLGVKSLETLIELDVAHPQIEGFTALFLQAGGGFLFKGAITIPPLYDDDTEYDGQLTLAVVEDTPANRKLMIDRLCARIVSNVQEQMNVLREHAPHLLSTLGVCDEQQAARHSTVAAGRAALEVGNKNGPGF